MNNSTKPLNHSIDDIRELQQKRAEVGKTVPEIRPKASTFKEGYKRGILSGYQLSCAGTNMKAYYYSQKNPSIDSFAKNMDDYDATVPELKTFKAHLGFIVGLAKSYMPTPCDMEYSDEL